MPSAIIESITDGPTLKICKTTVFAVLIETPGFPRPGGGADNSENEITFDNLILRLDGYKKACTI